MCPSDMSASELEKQIELSLQPHNLVSDRVREDDLPSVDQNGVWYRESLFDHIQPIHLGGWGLFNEAFFIPENPMADDSLPVLKREWLELEYGQDWFHVPRIDLVIVYSDYLYNPHFHHFESLLNLNLIEPTEEPREISDDGIYLRTHQQASLLNEDSFKAPPDLTTVDPRSGEFLYKRQDGRDSELPCKIYHRKMEEFEVSNTPIS